MLSQRSLLLACAVFLLLFLFFVHNPYSPYGLPYGSFGDETRTPEYTGPGEGKFDWSKVAQRYPVRSFMPMPSGVVKLPKIQGKFSNEDPKAREVRLSRLKEIKAEFTHAWTGYKSKAWLNDEVAPLSGGTKNSFGGWAATLVDSLDTLWIMGLKDEFEEAVKALDQIDFSTCALEELNVFETTIRHLGGFLSAYDLTEGHYPILLKKAWELGHMLYAAFDTPNRMPVTRWKFKDAAAGRSQTPAELALSAEVGSLTLEFTRLSQLTGDLRFYDAVQRIMDVFEAQQKETKLPGMWPIVVNAKTLDFTDYGLFTIGGMADSLYEYLPKQHMMLGGATQQYKNLFETAAGAMKQYMFYRPMTREEVHILMPGDVISDGKSWRQDPKNQHLTCFAGGMFGIAGKLFNNPQDVEVGRRLTEGCLWAYEITPTGIMPETMYTLPCTDVDHCPWDNDKWIEAVGKAYSENNKPADGMSMVHEHHLQAGMTKVSDKRYILRPEAIESIFVLYRITGDEKLRERAWAMFKNIIRLTRTSIAHAALDDILTETSPQADSMESFWTAETLKYFYLLFSDPGVVSLDDFVFNTEAHPLRRPALPQRRS